MEVVYVYQRKRKDFGKQPLFSDRAAELTVSIPPEPSYMKNYVERNPCHFEVQASAEKSEHEVNTETASFTNRGILHTQGGWPKDVDATDVEHTIRYRKKIEKDDEYVRSIKSLGDTVEHCIRQNNAIDIFEEYFEDSGAQTSSVPPSTKSLNVFRDPNHIKRTAFDVSWYPDEGHKFAVAYSVLKFQSMPLNMSLDSYIWDIEVPNTPDQTLTPISPIVSLKYNPKDPHILVGGCYNGILCFLYLTQRTGILEKIQLHWIAATEIPCTVSHGYNPNLVVDFYPGSEFFSTSTDGQVMWWDIRKLSEPTETMLIDPERNGNIIGGTHLDFETTMPTKFMIGGENGTAYMCNKKAKNPGEKITHAYAGHHGPIYALQRNPFFVKNFLTIGDWKAQIWSEEVKSPIMSTNYATDYLTDACWSPTRPSVFLTSKRDGSIDIWDYLLRQNEPALTVQISNSAIHSVRAQEHGKLVSAAQQDGSVTIFELCDGLSKIQPEEKKIFSEMLDRELKREKTMEASIRERRLKANQKPVGMISKPNGAGLEELLKAAEEDFYSAIDNGSGTVRAEAAARAREYDQKHVVA